MLKKCANPACASRFRYLHEGQIFTLELERGSGLPVPMGEGETSHRIERFWLCETCKHTLTVVYENGQVTTRPVPKRSAAKSADLANPRRQGQSTG